MKGGLMGENFLSSLIIPIALDVTKFSEGIKKVAGDAESTFSSIGDKLSSIGGKMTTGVTLPIIGGLTGAVLATQNWTEKLDSIGDVLGTSADESASLAVAIEGVGGSTEALTTQMAFLVKGLDDGKGGLGTTGKLLTDMGIAFKDANGQMLPSVDIISGVADKIALLPDGLEKTKLQTQLFGKSGKDLSDVMNALANGGLENAKNKAKDLGLLMGDEGSEKTLAFGRSMNTLKLGAEGLGVSLGTTLIPIASQLIGWLQQGLAWFNGLNPSIKETIVVVLALVAGIGPLLTIIGTLSTVIGAVIPVVTAIAGVISFPLIAIILAIGAVIALIALAWKNNWGGIKQTVEVVIKVIKDIISAFQKAFSGDWKGFGEDLRKAWDTAWNAITNALSNAWTNIKKSLGELIKSAIAFFRDTDWGQVGKNIVQGIANGITSAIDWVIKAIMGLASAVLRAIKGFLGISSPSKVMKMQVGYEMATGQLEGYQEGIKKFKPKLNLGMNTGDLSSSQKFINFVYQPMFSLANKYEAENVMKPIVESIVRKL
jgi:phage-related protein